MEERHESELPRVVAFIVYEKATGEILRSGFCAPTLLALQGEHVLYCESLPAAVDLSFYVLDGALVARPDMQVPESMALSVGETVVLSDLPNACRAVIDGEEYILDDGTLDLEATMPAEYEIRFSKFPYIPATLKVIVREG